MVKDYHLPAKLSCLNFHPLEVVSRYRDSKIQVGDNYYSYLFESGRNAFVVFNMLRFYLPPQGTISMSSMPP